MRGDPLVANERPLGAVALGVDTHRAQLDDVELAAVLSEAALFVEHGTAVDELDRECGDRQDREKQNSDHWSRPRGRRRAWRSAPRRESAGA